MTQTAFTPGPWQAVRTADWDRSKRRLPYHIANSTGVVTTLSTANEANARLIAEAPAMYEALEEFVARVEAGEISSRRTYEKFKSILARVRGEQ